METCFAEAERLNSWQPPDSTAFNRAVPFLPPRSIRVHTQRKSPNPPQNQAAATYQERRED